MEPANRILVMSAPRTGSTATMALLEKAGFGYNPIEILDLLTCAQNNITSQNALAFIRKLAAQNATDAGFFSCKVHYNQLERVFKGAEPLATSWLRYFTHYIMLRRRDRIAQAISEYFAWKSNVWNVSADAPAPQPNGYVYTSADFGPIAYLLSRQIREDSSWLSIISQLQLNVVEIFYEDLIADPAATLHKLTVYLGVTLPEDFKAVLSNRKVSDPEAVDKCRDAFIADLGIDVHRAPSA